MCVFFQVFAVTYSFFLSAFSLILCDFKLYELRFTYHVQCASDFFGTPYREMRVFNFMLSGNLHFKLALEKKNCVLEKVEVPVELV